MLLQDKFPHLASMFSSKNETPFSETEYRSLDKLKWTVCDKGHILYKTALEIQRYPRCQSCALIAKNNIDYKETIAYLYPEIASLVADTSPYAPDALRPDSKCKTVTWEDTDERIAVCDRVRHVRKDQHPENLFVDEHPQYASWCVDDNANMLSTGSSKSVNWQCPQGHTFSSSVRNFIKRTHKCTVCSGITCVTGVNDIATLHPAIAAKITSPDPSTITLSYSGKVQFACTDCGYAWTSTLSSTTVRRHHTVHCPACIGKAVHKGHNDLLSRFPHVASLWHESNTVLPDEITCGSETRIFLHCATPSCDNIVATHPYVLSRNQNATQPVCTSCRSSSGERELGEFIAQLGFDPVYNDREVLNGKELDIYIPEKNLAIEFNGLYWHSEQAGKDKSYHARKWQACKDNNIQLITIWENDWRDKRDIVTSMLASKLGVSQQAKVMARKTTVDVVDQQMATAFFDKYHIQGHARGCHVLGLFTQSGKLICAMSVRVSGSVATIVRYATSCVVPGGFTKLVAHVERSFRDVDRIESFSDNEISSGHLYAANGFVQSEVIPPDYKYVYKGTRYHKFNFRKQRFKDDNALVYQENLSEKDLACINGMFRVWDCGKIKWTLRLD